MKYSKERILERIKQSSAFVDIVISEGTLTGTSSPPPVVINRLNAFREKLANAQSLFENRKIEDCFAQMVEILSKCDNQEPPIDFVTGSARESVATQINDLITILAAEIERDHAYGCFKAQGKI